MSAAVLHTRTEQCEWNPAEDRPCYVGEHDASAVFGVGPKWRTHLHLCSSCAALPRFKRFKKEVLPGAVAPTPAAAPDAPTAGTGVEG